MSHENIQRIRDSYAAFSRGDFDAALEDWDEATEFELPEDMPERSSFRGPEGARQFWATMLDVFEEFSAEPKRIIAAGDETYVVFVTERTRRKGDETAVEEHNAHIIKYRSGKTLRLQVFLDPRDALEAAGLSEQDAHADSA